MGQNLPPILPPPLSGESSFGFHSRLSSCRCNLFLLSTPPPPQPSPDYCDLWSHPSTLSRHPPNPGFFNVARPPPRLSLPGPAPSCRALPGPAPAPAAVANSGGADLHRGAGARRRAGGGTTRPPKSKLGARTGRRGPGVRAGARGGGWGAGSEGGGGGQTRTAPRLPPAAHPRVPASLLP